MLLLVAEEMRCLSRVIKGIVWSDDPRVISVSGTKSQQSDMERMSDQAYQDMIMNLRAREERAEKMLRDAKIECEIIKNDALQQGRMQAQAEADELMNNVRRQAEAEAEEIKRTTYEAAYKEGLEKGRQDGEEAVRTEQQHIINSANSKSEKTLANARDEVQRYIIEGENTFVEMVLQIADKVLTQHVIDVPQAVLPLVREAIKKVQDQPKVVVRVAPEAYEYVLPARAELQSMLDGDAVLEIAADESMQLGDCILDSPNGTVDARLTTQLEQIRQAVRDMKN